MGEWFGEGAMGGIFGIGCGLNSGVDTISLSTEASNYG